MNLADYFEQIATDVIGHQPELKERFAMLEVSETGISIRQTIDVDGYIMLLALPNSQLEDLLSDNPHDAQPVELYIVKLCDSSDFREVRKAVYTDCKDVLFSVMARLRKDRQAYIIHGFDLARVDMEPVFGMPDPNYFGHSASLVITQSIASKIYGS